LDALKPAIKSRKRKREHTASSHTDPKKIKPEVCDVRKGKLFRVACREEVSLKNSTVKNHLAKVR
jgi:hypothetical protein